jgi:hypothetical protein
LDERTAHDHAHCEGPGDRCARNHALGALGIGLAVGFGRRMRLRCGERAWRPHRIAPHRSA